MSDDKAARLAAIRAANAQKRSAQQPTDAAEPAEAPAAPAGGKAARLAAIRAANAQKRDAAPAEPIAPAAPAAAPPAGDKAARLAAIRQANAQKRDAEPAAETPAPPAGDKAARLAAIRQANAAKAEAAPAAPVTAARSAPVAARPAPAATPLDSDEPAMAFQSLLLLLLSVVLGAFAAVFVLPRWLPGLSASLLGPEPKAYWFLSRSSAMVAYGLLWLSMALGLSISGKLARIWPGGPTVFDMHQHASLLGLAFGLFHGLILMGDTYINYSLMQVLVPFRSGAYRPFWVGLGQLALYGLALVGLSFYARPLIGRRAWRLIHFLSFLVFALALFHGVKSGTDTQHAWARIFYWATGGSLIFLTIYRILITATNKRPAPARA